MVTRTSIAEVDYSSASASGPAPRQQTAPSHPISTATDLRPGQVFAGYPAYPPASAGGSSMAPSSYNPLDALGRPGGAGTMISAPASGVRETSNAHPDFVPESRKRKVEEVDGHQQEDRMRLGMQFSHEGSSISPSSYRTYSDFPRSSYPSQMPAPATTGRLSRGAVVEDEDSSPMVRTAVRTPTLEHAGDDAAFTSAHCSGGKEQQRRGRRPIRGRGGIPRCHGAWSQVNGGWDLSLD
jgi:hypothetical protein